LRVLCILIFFLIVLVYLLLQVILRIMAALVVCHHNTMIKEANEVYPVSFVPTNPNTQIYTSGRYYHYHHREVMKLICAQFYQRPIHTVYVLY